MMQENLDFKRFCIITGDINWNIRSNVLRIINDPENNRGKNIRVILLSSAAAEGIHFYGVRYIHILEPYWNYSRIK